MGSYPEQPTDFEQTPKRPDPSDRFYLEKLINYYKARRMFVERDGLVMFRDSYQPHRARPKRVPLRLRAHEAYLAFLWGDREAVDVFLEHLFRSWLSFPEGRRSALREALFAELAGS